MYGRVPAATRAAVLGLALALLIAALPASSAAAAPTREPLGPGGQPRADSRPGAVVTASDRVLAASRARSAAATGGGPAEIASVAYGAAETGAIAAVLRGLPHGPELSLLRAYVATPAEISALCGATVLACYFPARMQMVVSGLDRSLAGVSRDFAIAHEYGHHIANLQRGDLIAPLGGGTIRWATYERVCRYTRANRLFPGDQGGHYWQNPEEAFAQSYAQLAYPEARVSWQYTNLLAPSAASLAKIAADVARPWQGPVRSALGGDLAAPARSLAPRHLGSAGAALDSARSLGPPSAVARRTIKTPLDGAVAVSLTAPPEARFAAVLRSASSGRELARAVAANGEPAQLEFENCGHDHLSLEVRSLRGAGAFSATVTRP